jgi:hypothetical protein
VATSPRNAGSNHCLRVLHRRLGGQAARKLQERAMRQLHRTANTLELSAPRCSFYVLKIG